MLKDCTKSSYLTVALFLIGFFVFLTGPVFALTISPVRMEISGDPGQTLQGELELLNEQKESKTFYSSTQNFEARGESGAPYFLPDTAKGLASWIRVQESVTLKPDEQKTIPFSVEIPRNTEPAGYFAAIFWGTSPPQTQGGGEVTVGGKLGVLILLSVSGETQEGGGILELKTDGGGFFGAVRNEWKNFAFGLYKAELDLTYGQEQKTAEAQFRFFVFTWHLLSIVFAILAIFGLLGIVGLKKYNRWIISKHISRDT